MATLEAEIDQELAVQAVVRELAMVREIDEHVADLEAEIDKKLKKKNANTAVEDDELDKRREGLRSIFEDLGFSASRPEKTEALVR